MIIFDSCLDLTPASSQRPVYLAPTVRKSSIGRAGTPRNPKIDKSSSAQCRVSALSQASDRPFEHRPSHRLAGSACLLYGLFQAPTTGTLSFVTSSLASPPWQNPHLQEEPQAFSADLDPVLVSASTPRPPPLAPTITTIIHLLHQKPVKGQIAIMASVHIATPLQAIGGITPRITPRSSGG